MANKQKRQEEPRKLDAWLSRLHREHSHRFNLLAVALAILILLLAALLKWAVEGLLNWLLAKC